MAKVKRKQKANAQVPVYVLIGAGVLLLAAVIFIALQGNGGATPTTPPRQVGADGIPRATLEEAKQAFDEGTAVFLDVRGDDVYAMQHVSGALSIPLNEIESRLGELEPGDWIIPYCT
jgi:hypothetical protein